jgi:2,3-bisphosphoglycerate-independent phosphoglycerate mutase
MATSGFSWTLPDHPKLPKGKPVAVVVLDGWGEADADQYNCIHVAETPVMDSLKNVCMPIFALSSCFIACTV